MPIRATQLPAPRWSVRQRASRRVTYGFYRTSPARCPPYSRKQTSFSTIVTSALRQKQTSLRARSSYTKNFLLFDFRNRYAPSGNLDSVAHHSPK
jgi:hypothetical protein